VWPVTSHCTSNFSKTFVLGHATVHRKDEVDGWLAEIFHAQMQMSTTTTHHKRISDVASGFRSCARGWTKKPIDRTRQYVRNGECA
jgi:gamma-glutamyl-gamma-aminobutyrate hydrolase PuuD